MPTLFSHFFLLCIEIFFLLEGYIAQSFFNT